MNEGFRALPEEVQKKILGKAGGGVMQRPLFRQMGGPAEPMPQDMAQGAQQEGQMLGQEIAARTQESIDAATDVEGAINALRGNDMPLDARYQELAGLVGERDAMQTPESVLALTQPAIMMTQQGAMDSGIGELMQAVAGDTQMDQGMDEGLGALMMQGAGSTPPENFRRGGPVEVRRFSVGGESVADRAGALQSEFLPLFQDIYGTPEQRAAELEKDRQMARSQMMFDIAKAGLAFAGETQGGSVAERLANAVNRAGTFDAIGQRAASMRALEKQSDAEDKAARSAALSAGITEASAQQRATEDLEKATATKTGTKPDFKRLVGSDGNILGTFDVNSAAGLRAFNAAIKNDPTAVAYNLGTQPSDKDFKTITLFEPGKEKEPPQTYPINTAEERKTVGELLKLGYTSDDTFFAATVADEFAKKAEDRAEETQIRQEDRAVLRETNTYIRNRADEIADMDRRVKEEIEAENRALDRTLDREERDILYFEKRLVLQTQVDVSAEERALGRTLDAEERANAEARARLTIQEEMAIRAEARALANRDNIEVREVDGQLMVFDKTKPDEAPKVIFGEASVPDPEYRQFTIQQDGKTISLIEDINSVAGKALIDTVNQQQEQGLGSSMQRISTASVTPKGYLIPKEGVFMSYDGGKTYVDDQGVNQPMPGGAFTVSDTIAYDVAKNERMRASAIAALEDLDAQLVDGGDFTKEEKNLVRNAYEAARNGTGFWSKVIAGVDAVVGGVTGADVAIETQDARQFVRMVRVLGRSALAASPRFAVADLQTTEQLFPNEQTLISNPDTEARKLLTLKAAINEERRRILELRASGAPIDPAMNATLNQKLFEIERLNDMLGPIETTFSGTSVQDATNSAAQEILNRALNKGKTGPSGN